MVKSCVQMEPMCNTLLDAQFQDVMPLQNFQKVLEASINIHKTHSAGPPSTDDLYNQDTAKFAA